MAASSVVVVAAAVLVLDGEGADVVVATAVEATVVVAFNTRQVQPPEGQLGLHAAHQALFS